jgi:hypothetical protein
MMIILSLSQLEEQEVFYPLYSRLVVRNIMDNLNNNERKNNYIVTAVITKIPNGERREVVVGGSTKK